jgi:hypothetical protein
MKNAGQIALAGVVLLMLLLQRGGMGPPSG